jgi:protocatechuate 3,4-dioxygenase alpha subunit
MSEVGHEAPGALETRGRLVPTPSQTAGPFLSIGTEWLADGSIAAVGAAGGIIVTGRVLDGAGMPVTDAVLEFWQADADGRYPPETAPDWTGFTRALTDHEGRYRLQTVAPGRVAAGDGTPQAPHIDVSIFARGLLQRLVTRIYLSDEEAANALDPVLCSISEAAAASSLIARAGPGGYELDLRLQGDGETIFFVP